MMKGGSYARVATTDAITDEGKCEVKRLTVGLIVLGLLATAVFTGLLLARQKDNEKIVTLWTSGVHQLHQGSTVKHFGPLFFQQAQVAISSVTFLLSNRRAEETIHHILVRKQRGCQASQRARWATGSSYGETIFAWAKTAARTEPQGSAETRLRGGFLASEEGDESPMGFQLDKETGDCLFLETHFEVREGTERQHGSFAIGLEFSMVDQDELHNVTSLGVVELAATQFEPLAPGESDAQVCVMCDVHLPFVVVGARSHGHEAGRVFASFQVTPDGQHLPLVSGNVQEPQVFREAQHKLVQKDSKLLLVCHYNTEGRTASTPVGPSPQEMEMCNQYLVFFRLEKTQAGPVGRCQTVSCQV